MDPENLKKKDGIFWVWAKIGDLTTLLGLIPLPCYCNKDLFLASVGGFPSHLRYVFLILQVLNVAINGYVEVKIKKKDCARFTTFLDVFSLR